VPLPIRRETCSQTEDKDAPPPEKKQHRVLDSSEDDENLCSIHWYKTAQKKKWCTSDNVENTTTNASHYECSNPLFDLESPNEEHKDYNPVAEPRQWQLKSVPACSSPLDSDVELIEDPKAKLG
jgi:hypothetical protein